MKSLFLTAVAVAALFAAGTSIAHAAQITGNINLVGDFKPTINGSATQNMALANGLDFLPLGGGTGTFQTLTGTDDLSAYANLSGGSIKDFTFNVFSPVSAFYSISTGGNTLTFDLGSLSIDNQNASFINLSGTGTIHATGFDDTAGTVTFSGQSTNGASPRATFSFSAGTDANPETPTSVPEPASLGLIGLGLVGIGALRRRTTKA